MRPFKFSFKMVGLLIAAVVVGAVFSFYIHDLFVPPYEPVGTVSIGIIQDTVPGRPGNAVYEGTAVHYNSNLCLNSQTPVDAIVTVKWRQFEPELQNIKDPALTEFPLRLQPGCERTVQSELVLPSFVTPGVWSIEADIKVTKGVNQAQVTKFATTRFTVLPAGSGPPSVLPSITPQ